MFAKLRRVIGWCVRLSYDRGIAVGYHKTRSGRYVWHYGWIVRVHLGNGAGYRWGRTAWIGRRVRGGTTNPQDMYRRRWSIGFTGKGNGVPWVTH
jgi:hypothetical protein